LSAGIEQALTDPSSRRAVRSFVQVGAEDERAAHPTEVVREITRVALALARSQAEVR